MSIAKDLGDKISVHKVNESTTTKIYPKLQDIFDQLLDGPLKEVFMNEQELDAIARALQRAYDRGSAGK